MTRYPVSMADKAQVERTYQQVGLDEDQVARVAVLRDRAIEFARLLMESCPQGRERSVALTKLDEVVMWAEKAIERERR